MSAAAASAATPRAALGSTAGSGLPLYARVHSLLMRRIEAREWQPGDKLPTVEHLAGEYGVARVTVREAMAGLERDGIVRRERGRGTTLIRDLSQRRWLMLPTDWDELLAHIDERPFHMENLAEGRVPGNPDAGEPAEMWQARRIIRDDEGVPYGMATIRLGWGLYQLDPEGFRHRPALPLMQALRGQRITWAHQTMTISTADAEASSALRLGVGDPVALVRREAGEREGETIYAADLTYPAQYLRIETRLL